MVNIYSMVMTLNKYKKEITKYRIQKIRSTFFFVITTLSERWTQHRPENLKFVLQFFLKYLFTAQISAFSPGKLLVQLDLRIGLHFSVFSAQRGKFHSE